MDFIGGLPKAKGMDTIFVVVDGMTKYAHLFPLSHLSQPGRRSKNNLFFEK